MRGKIAIATVIGLLSTIFIVLLFSGDSNFFLNKSSDFKKFEISLSGFKHFDRGISSDNKHICLDDKIKNTDAVKDEIQNRSLTSRFKSGISEWKFKDISRFTAQEKYFLDNFNTLAFNNTDFSLDDKRSIPELLNSLYGLDKSDITGFLEYDLFLKTGYIISHRSRTPLNGGYFRNAETFSKDEIAGIFRASHFLPENLKFLSKMKALFRFPRNKIADGMDETTSAYYLNATEASYIAILDRGTNFSYSENKHGFGYDTFVHEMGHAFDYSNTNENDLVMSERPSWLSISGWEIKTGTDANNPQRIIRKWKNDNSKEGFVREYASQNPNEDFAETISYYRLKSEEALINTPNKYKFLKENVFNNKEYTSRGIVKYYTNIILSDINTNLNSFVTECNNSENLELTEVKNSVISLPIQNTNLKNCLENKFTKQFNDSIDKIKAEEPEGCQTLIEKENHIKTEVGSLIRDSLDKIADQNKDIEESLYILNEFRQALYSTDAKNIMIKCYKSTFDDHTDFSKCFNDGLLNNFEATLTKFQQIEKIANIEREFYLNQNTFNATISSTIEIYSKLFIPSEMRYLINAKKLYQFCKKNLTSFNGDNITYTPFTGGTEYILNPRLINCVNKDFINSLDEVTNNVLDQFGLSISKDTHKLFIYNKILIPYYENLILTVMKVDAEKESTVLTELFNKAAGEQITNILSSNFSSWFKFSETQKDSVTSNCETETYNNINKNTLTQKDLLFHSSENLIKTKISERCQEEYLKHKENAKIELKKMNSYKESIFSQIRKKGDKASCIEWATPQIDRFINTLVSRYGCTTNFITKQDVLDIFTDEYCKKL